MRLTDMANKLRSAGLSVIEEDGWETRGSSYFYPKGVVAHHTASNRYSGPVPSLHICKYGRTGIPGPLCQVLIGRDRKVHVIASGRANHAGTGGWRGLTGNSSVIGVEVENDGIGEPWSTELMDVYFRVTRVLLDLIGKDYSWVCFPEETTVLTSEGLKFIKEVEVGDLVWTHKSRFRPVVRVGSQQKETVILKGNGHPGLETTADHRFFSPEHYRGRSVKNNSCNNILFRDEERWIEAQDMAGQYWATPRLDSVMAEEVPLVKSNHLIGGDMILNEDFMELTGRLVADGWWSKNSVELCCGHHETSEVELLVKKVWPHYATKTKKSTHVFRFQSAAFVDWLSTHFGKYAYGKELPGWVYGLSHPMRESFLMGYLSGDGYHIGNGRYESSSVSKKLSFGLKMLCQSLGFKTSIHLEERQALGYEIDGRLASQRDRWILKINMKDSNRSQILEFSDDLFVSRCKTVLPGSMRTVYDIEVDEDHSFVADGIVVHNCGHKEWTSRKIDPYPISMDMFRNSVKNVSAPAVPQPEWRHVTDLPVGVNDYGSIVLEIQQRCNYWSHEVGKADGWFGTKTETGVKSFQGVLGVGVDGIWGELTEAAYDTFISQLHEGDHLIPSGTSLEVGEMLHSKNGEYALAHQSDGNLVVYDTDRSPVWASWTQGKTTSNLVMQTDGNLVLLDDSDSPIWHTHTYSDSGNGVYNYGAFAVMQDDGNFVIYNAQNKALWSSKHGRTY